MSDDTRLDSLDLIENAIWEQLVDAAHHKGHDWRTPVLATATPDGVNARTVVLREIRRGQRELLFYTDSRAAKVQEIATAPHGMLVMWSPQLSWQLRCQVALDVQYSGLDVLSRWAQVKLSPAAQDYLSAVAPGTPVDLATPPQRASREHFAVVTAAVTSLDWLELHPEGHRRARFDVDGARWLQP
ncbi:pyridoxamine 5'-phosphate oxidase family protein [Caldimonas brevitalea]|uniref:Pyridoxamine 5'-phosphate oxidase n=1 Tax=Caldimonas brevitalea TaxID=413882 RepID=A0A0G3BXC8_9BURK|nr:pyridoxamine 5'-phosphate oxidase family protein [Caldimonas brevitalea]AKJ31185.1 pyridoxamine 5'-phosphate oxidase [Caldimonas brevitalea]